MTLNEGWLYIDYGGNDYQVLIDDWSLDIIPKPTIIDIPADSRIGFDLNYVERILVIRDAFFFSDTDIETLIAALNTLNVSGPFPIRIKNKDAASNWFKLDGTNEELDFLYLEMRGIRKPAKGDAQYYVIERIQFKQAS